MRLGNGVFSLSFPPPRVSYDVSSLVFLRVHGAHGYTRPRHRTRRMTATDRLPRRLRICQRRQTEKKKKKKNHSTKNALCTFEIVSLSPKPFLPSFLLSFSPPRNSLSMYLSDCRFDRRNNDRDAYPLGCSLSFFLSKEARFKHTCVHR